MSRSIGLPLTFLARMADLLDEEFPTFLAALSRPPVAGLRVNTLKLSVAEFLALCPWELKPVPWCDTGFLLPPTHTASTYPLYDAGLYYLQEPSTMAVATLLAPRPGERVLDLCAAPGGKATHIAALMADQGVLVANEVEPDRAAILARNLETWGARHALVLSETPERLAERWPEAFDRVLVDAPCSGEGMFRKSEQARYHWSEAHVAGCALRQQDILDAAAALVRPGGLLAYATCTFAPEENEGVVWRFLQSHPDFDLEEPAPLPGLDRGRPAWAFWPPTQEEVAPAALPDARAEALSRTARLWPHRTEGEGHFVALLRRRDGAPRREWRSAAASELTSRERAALAAFWEPTVGLPLPERLLVRSSGEESEVYALAEDAPDVRGLRALRPGWLLGTLRKGRFIPAHALALGLRRCEALQRLDLPLGSEEVARYLRGEPLPSSGADGWVVVCVEGFPLGWGKRVSGLVKNHYPKALRWP
ncbi:MAG: RsmB/NOP family class I SAM-dependent RNA methyltransferase [Caldilineales bacterium]|nr:RsmB/NOP family class I SAM-dependent RNA methyltransferase [Caldilineales bacterium]MDW8317990.1 RsmB/NOP family class I SAM-dependent RNA methyltransferase [Anaerolineae bacterium]